MHFLNHFMRKRLCPAFSEGCLIVLSIETILSIVQLLAHFARFCNLTSLKILSLVALGIVHTAFKSIHLTRYQRF